MVNVSMNDIQMRGTDAVGRFAMAELDGEWQGVSVLGEDEVVRDLASLRPGMRIEVGSTEACIVDDEGGAS